MCLRYDGGCNDCIEQHSREARPLFVRLYEPRSSGCAFGESQFVASEEHAYGLKRWLSRMGFFLFFEGDASCGVVVGRTSAFFVVVVVLWAILLSEKMQPGDLWMGLSQLFTLHYICCCLFLCEIVYIGGWTFDLMK